MVSAYLPRCLMTEASLTIAALCVAVAIVAFSTILNYKSIIAWCILA